jgi:hypothetical protein
MKFDPFPPIRQRNYDLILPRPSCQSSPLQLFLRGTGYECPFASVAARVTKCSFAAYNPFGRVSTSALGDVHATSPHLHSTLHAKCPIAPFRSCTALNTFCFTFSNTVQSPQPLGSPPLSPETALAIAMHLLRHCYGHVKRAAWRT